MSGAEDNYRVSSDRPFLLVLAVLGGGYLFLIAAMVVADLIFLDYRDRPVFGPEIVEASRYPGDASGVKITLESSRRYYYQGGRNELGFRMGGNLIKDDGVFDAVEEQVLLVSETPEGAVTASFRPEVRVVGIQLHEGVATLRMDLPHGLLWGEFIRVRDSGSEFWDGVHEITDTTQDELSFVVGEKSKIVNALSLSRPNPLIQALRSRDIQFSIKLSLVSCTVTTLLSLWVAIPIGYLMSRFTFRGKALVDTLLDIPVVLPPLVVGLSLLILFRYVPDWLSDAVVYKWPAVVLAQFMVACAFAVRTMRVTFDQIPQRYEQVALTLGCNRQQAFWRVVLPQARGGVLAAGTLAWARALGEFGPILVFAGATRQKTEVLPTSAFLELQAGRTEGMLAVSLIMIATAALVFVVARTFGMKRIFS